MRFLSTLVLLLGLVLAPPAVQAQTGSQGNGGTSGSMGNTEAGEVEAQVFVSALRAIARFHQTPFSDSTLWHEALDGLVESLEDPYASVFTPEEAEQFDESNTGNYAGIGVQITELNDVVTITAVFRSTPADNAGLQVGDVIVGVNGTDALEWSSDMVADSVRGPVGTTVNVDIRRDGYDRPLGFPLTRAQVHVPAVTADLMAGDILYVGMDRVARGAAQEMDSVLRQYRTASGIVIDLRRNPGGYLDESLMLADLFLEPGKKLASTRSRNPGMGTDAPEFEEQSWDARMIPRLPETPIVVLVDDYTASAAEILAGALQDYDRALILGQRTFGKGVVQTVLDLPHGRRLRLTTGAWYTPLGRSLHRERDGSGVPRDARPVDSLPTIRSEQGRELVAAGGIFPDLGVAYDTLTLRERELLQSAAEAEIPLPLRLAEFGFSQAQVLSDAGRDPALPEPAFQTFLDGLVEEGLSAELLGDPELRDYLAWRARVTIADRMNRLGVAAEIRRERDTMLDQAIRLLVDYPSQTALFGAAERLSETADGDASPESTAAIGAGAPPAR